VGSVGRELQLALALSLDGERNSTSDGNGPKEHDDQEGAADPDFSNDQSGLGCRHVVHRLANHDPPGRRRRSCESICGAVDRDRRRGTRVAFRAGEIEVRQTLRRDGSVGGDMPDEHRQRARILARGVEALLVGRPSAGPLANVRHLDERLLKVAVHFGRQVVGDYDRHRRRDHQVRDTHDRAGGQGDAYGEPVNGGPGRRGAAHASSRR
jgi:hypothetical protein